MLSPLPFFLASLHIPLSHPTHGSKILTSFPFHFILLFSFFFLLFFYFYFISVCSMSNASRNGRRVLGCNQSPSRAMAAVYNHCHLAAAAVDSHHRDYHHQKAEDGTH